MHYSQPQILRADNAVRTIQHVDVPDTQKPIGPILDECRHKLTDPPAYDADE